MTSRTVAVVSSISVAVVNIIFILVLYKILFSYGSIIAGTDFQLIVLITVAVLTFIGSVVVELNLFTVQYIRPEPFAVKLAFVMAKPATACYFVLRAVVLPCCLYFSIATAKNWMVSTETFRFWLFGSSFLSTLKFLLSTDRRIDFEFSELRFRDVVGLFWSRTRFLFMFIHNAAVFNVCVFASLFVHFNSLEIGILNYITGTLLLSRLLIFSTLVVVSLETGRLTVKWIVSRRRKLRVLTSSDVILSAMQNEDHLMAKLFSNDIAENYSAIRYLCYLTKSNEKCDAEQRALLFSLSVPVDFVLKRRIFEPPSAARILLEKDGDAPIATEIVGSKVVQLTPFIHKVTKKFGSIFFPETQSIGDEISMIFIDSQLHLWNIEAITNLLIRSLAEDRFGVVQDDLAKVISTLFKTSMELDVLSKRSAVVRSESRFFEENYVQKEKLKLSLVLQNACSLLYENFSPFFKAMKATDAEREIIDSFRLRQTNRFG